jgi:hypothetical protein
VRGAESRGNGVARSGPWGSKVARRLRLLAWLAVYRDSSGMRRTSSRVRERVEFSGGLAENQTTGRCSDGSAGSNKLNR